MTKPLFLLLAYVALLFATVTPTLAQGLTFEFKSADEVAVASNGYSASGLATITLGTALPTGANLTVIDNSSLSFITGTFSNLAQGQAVSLSFGGVTYNFVANYYGGTGNDLVLQWANVRLSAWGSNYDGEAGIGSSHSSMWEIWRPLEVLTSGVLGGKVIIAQAMGAAHSLALCSDGTLAAWGRNSEGQLGDGTITKRTAPVAMDQSGVLNGKTVVAITAGGFHSLALCSDGTLVSWGKNDKGQLGDNSTTDRTTAVLVDRTGLLAGKTIIALSAGYSHSLVLCSDGTLAAWGDNDRGELGNNSSIGSRVPVAVTQTGVLNGKTITSIAASNNHNAVLCSDGTLSTWGFNNNGQLGNGQIGTVTNPTQIQSRVPVLVKTGVLAGKKVKALAAGNVFDIVLCTDGTVAAWGGNYAQQLGSSFAGTGVSPVAVKQTGVLAGKNVISIAGASDHGFAFCDDGTLASWGSTSFGGLGNNDNQTLAFYEPVLVNTLLFTPGERFFSPASGPASDHSMALIASPPASSSVAWLGKANFGSALVANGLQTRTYKLTNVGASTLHFNGSPLVQIAGSDPEDFEVVGEPAASLDAGASTTLVIAFNPTSVGMRRATVTIATDSVSQPTLSFNIQGTGTLSTLLTQTITFAQTTTAYISQIPLTLNASASSGLPVALSLVTGTTAPGATLVGNVLSCTGPGVLKVQATQTGNAIYKAATAVTVTITVKADPTSGLTLINLSQVYDGTAKAAETLPAGASITYKQGSTVVAAPTNAGSYAVTATLGGVTKTGTLVIAKAPLYVMPDDQRKFAGKPNPNPLSYLYSGFVNGETATPGTVNSVVTKLPVLTTTAKTSSAGGIYPITASGGAAANYTLIYRQGTLVVETFAGSYEALLMDGAPPLPVGKVVITIPASSTSFTGKLYTATETAAIPLSHPLDTDSQNEQATATQTVTGKSGASYTVSFTLALKGTMTATVTRNGSALGNATDGRKLLALAKGKTVPYGGAHTAVLGPATPGVGVPAGAGWATASVSTAGVLTLAGQLGDGSKFSSTLSPDDLNDPGYRMFMQPYVTARADSFIGGSFSFVPHPNLANRRYLVGANLTWKKAFLATDATYRANFGPVTTVLIIDPWLVPTTANPLSVLLGLTGSSMGVSGTSTGSASQGDLATRIGVNAANLVSVQQPVANIPKWKATFTVKTGTFSGSFELMDSKKRTVSFSGVLRQPASAVENVVGEGNYLLPPLSGTESITGDLLFTRP